MKSYQWLASSLIFFFADMIVAWVATTQLSNTVMLLNLDMTVTDTNLFNTSIIISVIYVIAGIVCFTLFWFCLIRGYSKMVNTKQIDREDDNF